MPGFIVKRQADAKGVWLHMQLPFGEHVMVSVARDGWVSIYTTTEKGAKGPVMETLAVLDSGVLAQEWELWALSPLARATAILDRLAQLIDPAETSRGVRGLLGSLARLAPIPEPTPPVTTTDPVISLITTYPSKAAALQDLRNNQAALVAHGVDVVELAIAIEKHFGS